MLPTQGVWVWFVLASALSNFGAQENLTDDALERLRRLPVPATVSADLEQLSIRPGSDISDATVLHARLILDPPRWYVRIVDRERPGWLNVLRGNANGWEDREKLNADDERPTLKSYAGAAPFQRRALELIRRDVVALSKEFAVSATASAATDAATTAYTVTLLPLSFELRKEWKRVDLLLDAQGLVTTAIIAEVAGQRKTLKVLAATYAQPVDATVFAGLP